jgi:hypothetical protein
MTLAETIQIHIVPPIDNRTLCYKADSGMAAYWVSGN